MNLICNSLFTVFLFPSLWISNVSNWFYKVDAALSSSVYNKFKFQYIKSSKIGETHLYYSQVPIPVTLFPLEFQFFNPRNHEFCTKQFYSLTTIKYNTPFESQLTLNPDLLTFFKWLVLWLLVVLMHLWIKMEGQGQQIWTRLLVCHIKTFDCNMKSKRIK